MYADEVKKGYKINNATDIALKKNLCYSTSLIYLKEIMLPQIKQQCADLFKLQKIGLKKELKKYFENNLSACFTIKIPKMTDNFISVIQDWSKKELNRENAFRYEIVE